MCYSLAVGETVLFSKFDTFEKIGSAKVINSQPITDSATINTIQSEIDAFCDANRIYKRAVKPVIITLDRDLVVPNKSAAEEILDSKPCTITVKRTVWSELAAQHILVRGVKQGTIENNIFYGGPLPAIEISFGQYWLEGPRPNNVTIRGNVIKNSSYRGGERGAICIKAGINQPEVNNAGKRGEWGEAIITITPSHRPENETTEPYHKNIKIENNTFKTFDIPLVHARSVRGLTFSNNEIIKTNTYKPYAWQKSSFLLDGCREVVISGNKLSDDYISRNVVVEHMKKSDVKADKDQKFSLVVLDESSKPKYIDDWVKKN